MKIKQKWVVGILSAAFVVFGAVATPVLVSSPVFAAQDPPADTTDTTDPADDADKTDAADDNSVTCAVEKIGWILCPIMEGAAKISDKAFDILADNFLRTDPELVQDDSGTKVAWEVSRNLANIMFIIAFLFIIFSQVTGRGINNYGIKRMLPRLIIAAIAVNISYYICQLVVDATNILGYEIQNALAQISNTVGPSVFGNVSNFADTQTANTGVLEHGGILAIIVAGALAAGAVVWFLLPTIGALIPLILITVSTIIIVLLLRKAFIVLLIVLAPIAFVMYLLPNTEKYFTKWMNMFVQLLMVFPIVGLLFGAGQLASTVILVAGSNNGQAEAAASCNPDDVESRQKFNDDKSTNDNSLCGEKSVVITGGKNGMNECFPGTECRVSEPETASWTMGLVATGIAVAPLLAVWAVLKGALSAAGAIGGKISGAVEKGTRAGINGGANASKKRWEQSAFGRGQALRKQAKQDYKNERFLKGLADPNEEGISPWEKRRRQYTRTAAGGVPGALPDNLKIGSMQAQSARLDRAAALGSSLEEKRDKEETDNAQAAMLRSTAGNMDNIVEEFNEAYAAGDKVRAKAAQNLLFGMGGAGVDAFVKAMRGKSGVIADALATNVRQHHGNIKGTSAGVNSWANDGGTLDQAMVRSTAYSNLSADNINGQSGESLAGMRVAHQIAMQEYNTTGSAAALAQAQGIAKAASAAMKSQSFSGVKVNNKAIIEDLARQAPPN